MELSRINVFFGNFIYASNTFWPRSFPRHPLLTLSHSHKPLLPHIPITLPCLLVLLCDLLALSRATCVAMGVELLQET